MNYYQIRILEMLLGRDEYKKRKERMKPYILMNELVSSHGLPWRFQRFQRFDNLKAIVYAVNETYLRQLCAFHSLQANILDLDECKLDLNTWREIDVSWKEGWRIERLRIKRVSKKLPDIS